ncbi:MAG: hypothetical protein V1914_03065 [archaeon]
MGSFERLKSEFDKLKGSEELKEYLKTHEGAYFVSAFLISGFDSLETAPWILEYYWPENGKVATFSFDTAWKVTDDDNVMQKERKMLEELDFEIVKFDDPVGKVKEEFKGESPLKMIVILNSQNKSPMWNITVFTRSFKVVNFKIDAVTGKTESSKVDNLLQFQKKD